MSRFIVRCVFRFIIRSWLVGDGRNFLIVIWVVDCLWWCHRDTHFNRQNSWRRCVRAYAIRTGYDTVVINRWELSEIRRGWDTVNKIERPTKTITWANEPLIPAISTKTAIISAKMSSVSELDSVSAELASVSETDSEAVALVNVLSHRVRTRPSSDRYSSQSNNH